MLEVADFLLDDKNWNNVPKPHKSWNLLCYHLVTKEAQGKGATPEQEETFDFAWAAMMQQEYGYE